MQRKKQVQTGLIRKIRELERRLEELEQQQTEVPGGTAEQVEARPVEAVPVEYRPPYPGWQSGVMNPQPYGEAQAPQSEKSGSWLDRINVPGILKMMDNPELKRLIGQLNRKATLSKRRLNSRKRKRT